MKRNRRLSYYEEMERQDHIYTGICIAVIAIACAAAFIFLPMLAASCNLGVTIHCTP